MYELDATRSYTVEQISRMFQVSPSDVWIRERYGGRAFFPSDEGNFVFGEENDLSHLEVEGTPVLRGSRSASRPTSPPRQPLTLSATASSSTGSTPQSYPGFTSVISQSGGRRGGSGAFSLKVVHARITDICNNRPNFVKQGQTFVELTEATANVLHVTAAVQRELGEDHVIVTADGLEVRDSSGTQGTSVLLIIWLHVHKSIMQKYNANFS